MVMGYMLGKHLSNTLFKHKDIALAERILEKLLKDPDFMEKASAVYDERKPGRPGNRLRRRRLFLPDGRPKCESERETRLQERLLDDPDFLREVLARYRAG